MYDTSVKDLNLNSGYWMINILEPFPSTETLGDIGIDFSSCIIVIGRVLQQQFL